MKLCEVCGAPEHPEWKAHVFASNIGAASNGASNIVQVLPLAKQPETVMVATAPQVKRSSAGSKQRWARVDYNAYQREYMRKRRAK